MALQCHVSHYTVNRGNPYSVPWREAWCRPCCGQRNPPAPRSGSPPGAWLGPPHPGDLGSSPGPGRTHSACESTPDHCMRVGTREHRRTVTCDHRMTRTKPRSAPGFSSRFAADVYLTAGDQNNRGHNNGARQMPGLRLRRFHGSAGVPEVWAADRAGQEEPPERIVTRLPPSGGGF